MRKRNTPSGSGKSGRRTPSGRGGARSSSSSSRSGSAPRKSSSKFSRDDKDGPKRSFSPRSEKPYKRREEGDDKKPSRFSKPGGERGGDPKRRPYKSDSPRYSSGPEKPFRRSREEGDDKKPSRFSKPAGRRGDESKRPYKSDSSRYDSRSEPRRTREDGDDKRPSRFSKPEGERGGERRSYKSDSSGSEKPFRRSHEEGDDKRPSRFSKPEGDRRGESKRPYKSNSPSFDSRSEKPRRTRDDQDTERKPVDKGDSDAPKDKRGFFSKLTRGGKSFERRSHDRDFGKSVKDFSTEKEESKEAKSDKIRLNKYISNSGVCSRREADELITMGLVTVNGAVITELGYKINRGDVVKYDGKTLKAEKPVYILMNKPKGFLTTTKDPQERNTVMNIIGDAVKERVYPVGRLDRNTTGLLLLTNDGELTDKLSHPSYNVKKIYKVELDKPLTKADFQKVMDGIVLEEGRAVVDDLAIVSDDGKTVGIELHIGWNRVVRRIFERLEYSVVKLDRTIYAGLDKKDLPRGHWRFLTQEELVRLKHYK
jgi:23S rRNA pseudouridine2605 synthase